MTDFVREDDRGVKRIVSDGDVVLESDRNQDGVGDLVFRTGGVERARIDHAGAGTGWANVVGGSFSPIFNVKTLYGAIGDGVTDDTAAIQAAITAAAAVSGIVYFPTGKYKVSSTLTYTATDATRWAPGFQIVGAGMGVSQDLALYASVIVPTAAVTGAVISVSGVANSDNSNKGQLNGMQFRDFAILGRSGVGDGISLSYYTNAVFRNLTVTACTDGVHLHRQANGVTFGYANGTEFDNCFLVANTGWGIEMADAGAISADIHNCNIEVNTLGGVKWAPASPSTITGDTFIVGNIGPGLRIVAPTGTSAATGPRCYGAHIETNGAVPAGTYSTDDAQVVIDSADTPVFHGCTFLGSTSGQHSIKAGFGSGTVTGLVAQGNRHYGLTSVSAQRAFLFGANVARASILDKEIFGFGGSANRATAAQAFGGTGNGSAPRGTAGVGSGTVLEGSLSVADSAATSILAVSDLPNGARIRFQISTQGGSAYATASLYVASAGGAFVLVQETAAATMALSIVTNAISLTQTTGSTATFLWTAQVITAV